MKFIDGRKVLNLRLNEIKIDDQWMNEWPRIQSLPQIRSLLENQFALFRV